MKKTYRGLFFSILFISCFFCKGQANKIDSLEKIIKTEKNDTLLCMAYANLSKLIYPSKPDTLIPISEKIIAITKRPTSDKKVAQRLKLFRSAALENIAIVYYGHGKMKKALAYLDSALTIQLKLGNKVEIANAYNTMGVIYLRQGKSIVALNYFSKALAPQKELQEKHGMAYTYNNMGEVYQNLGKIKKALNYYYKGMKLQEEIHNKVGLGSSFDNIGALLLTQGDTTNALGYLKKALEVRKEVNDKHGMAQCLLNIGGVYLKSNPEKALGYYQKGLEIYKSIKDNAGIAFSYNNIATVYKTADKQDSALIFYRKSLKKFQSINSSKRGLTACLNNISYVLLKQNKKTEALNYAQQALQVADTSNYAKGKRDAYLRLYDTYQSMNKPKKALDYYKKYIIYRDSIINAKTKKAAVKKQLEYEFEKKQIAEKLKQEKHDALQQAAFKRKKIIHLGIIFSLILLLIFVALIFNRFRLKQKHNYQVKMNQKQKELATAVMDTQEEERKRIAENLHDGLGHLLSTIKINIQTLPETYQQVNNAVKLVDQASQEIRQIIFNLMPKALEEEGLVAALQELASKINETQTVEVKLYVHNLERFYLEKQSQFNIYRIIQEAINNILKHANASEINIQLIGQEKHINIMIEDNGKGFDPKEKSNGNGLKNILTRSLWLKGSLDIDSSPGHGTTITSTIPV